MTTEMTLDASTLPKSSPDGYRTFRDVLEQAFRETLTRMAAGQNLEHLLQQLMREPTVPGAKPAVAAPEPIALPLSERELQVLRHIAAGDSNKEIARALSLSLHTVKRHVANIFNKLGVESRVQAASFLNARH